MAAPRNMFKDRLRGQQIGLFATLNSPALGELLAGCGFDWILIDTEHSPGEMGDVVAQLHALQGHEVSVIVRPAWSDMVLIKRLLDAGAQSLLIPNVQTAQEAATAVSYARYPPAGVRGVSSGSRAAQYGQSSEYLRTADEQVCILAQIETPLAVGNLEAIAAVPGVDGLFIGPNDLAASMGYLGDAQHPAVQAAVDAAFDRMRALDIVTGYLTTDEAEARRRTVQGVHVMGVATDTSIINRGAAATLASLNRVASPR